MNKFNVKAFMAAFYTDANQQKEERTMTTSPAGTTTIAPAPRVGEYTIRQSTREWNWEYEDGQNVLMSADGIHRITTDPVYGYYRLATQEDPTEAISEHRVLHTLVLYADALLGV